MEPNEWQQVRTVMLPCVPLVSPGACRRRQQAQAPRVAWIAFCSLSALRQSPLTARIAQAAQGLARLLSPHPLPCAACLAPAESIGCSLAEAAESPAYDTYLAEAGATPTSLHVSCWNEHCSAGCVVLDVLLRALVPGTYLAEAGAAPDWLSATWGSASWRCGLPAANRLTCLEGQRMLPWLQLNGACF